MNNILKKAEKFPLIAAFFVLWFIVSKIISPILQMIFYKAPFTNFLPSFGGFVMVAAIITLAVMQILKKCNIVVPIAAGVFLLAEIFGYLGTIVSFFDIVFRSHANASFVVTSLIDGLVNLLNILAISALVVLGLYGAGIIKKFSKLKLLTFAPAILAIVAFVLSVISSVCHILFNIGNPYFVAGLVISLVSSIPAALWYALTIASAGLWAGGCGREREEINAEEVIEETVETPIE